MKELNDQELNQVSGGKTMEEWIKHYGNLYHKFKTLEKMTNPSVEQYKSQQVKMAVSKIEKDDDLSSAEKETLITRFNKLLS